MSNSAPLALPSLRPPFPAVLLPQVNESHCSTKRPVPSS
jgi:hypothetical protein